MNVSLITLAVLAVYISGSEAVKCYVCSFSSGAGLKSGSDNCDNAYSGGATHEFDCGDDVKYCQKVRTHGEFFGIKTDSTIRTCGTGCSSEKKDKGELAGIETIDACCEGALCNGAGSAIPALLLLASSVCVALRLH